MPNRGDPESSIVASSTLIKLEMENVRQASSIVDAFCRQLVGCSYEFSERGYIKWFHEDTHFVKNLRFASFESSLSQALAEALAECNIFSFPYLSLSLYLRRSGEPKLTIVPVQELVHCPTSRNQISNYGKSILQIDEDTAESVIVEVMMKAGPSFNNILLDAFANSVLVRRLDVAQLILVNLNKISGRSGDERVKVWITQVIEKYLDVFRSCNDGVSLNLS